MPSTNTNRNATKTAKNGAKAPKRNATKAGSSRSRTGTQSAQADIFKSMLDRAPTPVMMCDEDLVITYMNEASLTTLKAVEQYLPVTANDIVGQSIDIFHKDPNHQRHILDDQGARLPVRSTIPIGPERADLLVSAITADDGTYLGAMVTWELITEKLALAEEQARVKSMVENSPTNVLLADTDLNIVYANPASVRTLKTIEQYLPIKAEEALGKNIDIFHQDPSYQRNLLDNDGANLPIDSIITIGPEKAKLLVSAVRDQDGTYLGPMVTWEVITEQLRLKSEAEDTATNTAATNQVLERVNAAKTAEEAIASALATVREAFGWAYGSFWRLDNKEHVLRFDTESGSVNPEFRACTEAASFAKGVGLSGRTWQSMDMVFVPDIGEVTDCVRAPIAKRAGVKSGVCFPIVVGGELLGTMDFFALETLTLSPARSDAIRNVGRMVSGAVERITQQTEAAKVKSMVEQAPLNIMMADLDLNITYLNDSSMKTLRTIEQYLPVPVDQIPGNTIDIFHKDPSHQRRLLSNPANLPHNAKIQVGPETLDLQVSAVYDDNGTYVGPMVAWTVVSERLKMYEALYQSLKEVTTTLSAASSELSSSSTHMTDSARETVHKTEEVAAATEQSERNLSAVAEATTGMTESVNDIARNVQEANGITQKAVSMAESTNATISKLNESSEQIGKVVKLITTIAQQTNLLALNATIEAARAGEAGKGFAVVANEVKELARKTATATDEISGQIESIQADTQQSVSAIGEITGIISQINQITVTVATATEEQSSATADINRNIQEVANGTKDIARNIVMVTDAAKGSQDVAANLNESSEGLAKLASDLHSLITKFEDSSED